MPPGGLQGSRTSQPGSVGKKKHASHVRQGLERSEDLSGRSTHWSMVERGRADGRSVSRGKPTSSAARGCRRGVNRRRLFQPDLEKSLSDPRGRARAARCVTTARAEAEHGPSGDLIRAFYKLPNTGED